MNKKEPTLNKIRIWLTKQMLCPLCNLNRGLGDIKVVNSKEEKGLHVHTSCQHCQSSLMFALEVKEEDVYLIGIVTDLTHDDAKKFFNKKSVTIDEVLDWQNFWKQQNNLDLLIKNR